ncbi:MAG: UvrD-helicase domain-containing protein [Porticoccaceae bacterium]
MFIVGDGMQSLYGFRNANVGLFLEARSQPIGNIELTPLDLQVNFRSQAGIIDWVNDVFKLAFPSRDNIARGAVCYAPATPFHPALDGNAVTVDAFLTIPTILPKQPV